MQKRYSMLMLLLLVASLWATQGLTWARTTPSGLGVLLARGEPQPGDDRGGHGRGKDDAISGKREVQPGDDRGGHGHGGDDVILAKGEPQPGDDRGGHGGDDTILAKGEPQPGDDHGGHGQDDAYRA